MRYGYARVSSLGQSLDEQVAQLTSAGCEIVRQEKVSGKSVAGRTELEILLAFLRAGDELVVTRIDRLARSLRDLLAIVDRVQAANASFRALHQQIDTSGPAGRAFLQMLGVFAEFERELIRERQRAGIAAARVRGALPVRQPTIERAAVHYLLAEGVGAREVARRLCIGAASVYRIKRELEIRS